MSKGQFYMFDSKVAEKYGVNESIFLQNLIFWLRKNYANNHQVIDGRAWTYNSSTAFTKLFPFWSKDQINRIIKKLVDKNVILVDCKSEDKRNRTRWISLVDQEELLGFQEKDSSETKQNNEQNNHLHLAKPQTPFRETAKWTPLLYTDNKTTDSKHYIAHSDQKVDKHAQNAKPTIPHPPSSDEGDCSNTGLIEFDHFWNYYPRRIDKARARKIWKQKKLDKHIDQILNDLKARKETIWEGTEKKFVPHPSTYLNRKSWNDDATELEKFTNPGEKKNERRERKPETHYQRAMREGAEWIAKGEPMF